eukprot:644651-Pleurochrysis_carterae.AAC.1
MAALENSAASCESDRCAPIPHYLFGTFSVVTALLLSAFAFAQKGLNAKSFQCGTGVSQLHRG